MLTFRYIGFLKGSKSLDEINEQSKDVRFKFFAKKNKAKAVQEYYGRGFSTMEGIDKEKTVNIILKVLFWEHINGKEYVN